VPEPLVDVRRSKRRTRTVTAYREGDTLVVLIPARLSKAEEAHWVTEMQRRLLRGETKRRSPSKASDAALLARCAELSTRHLKSRAVPTSVRWVPPMRTRWASCTPADGTIRVSERLREVPGWVLDYVLVHELAHLVVPSHGPAHDALVDRFPLAERARGFLIAIDLDPDEGDEVPSLLAGDVRP
jgi:predicted metal-dependent hydrolase